MPSGSKAIKQAAVLIPVIDRPDGPSVLLTQRTEKLRTHSGQIAFPGGRIDPEDLTAETSSPPSANARRRRGSGATMSRSSGGCRTTSPAPVSGSPRCFRFCRPGYRIVPNPDEVDAVFDVPLAFLMDTANHRHGSMELGGKERFFYEMPYGDRHIWGITAGIIRLMYERLYE